MISSKFYNLRALFPAVLFLMIFFGGCGYHVAGKGGHLPGDFTTLSIPVFANNTGKPDIEFTLSSAFVSEFVNTVSIVDKDAQAVMQGSIKSYTLTPISFAKNDITQEYRLTVALAIRIVREETLEVVWEDDNVVDYEDFSVNIGDVAATRDRETAALKKLSKDTARLVKERMLEGF
jgi:outer membrane lipopolysaccharide assembly protein LptE/RlpB